MVYVSGYLHLVTKYTQLKPAKCINGYSLVVLMFIVKLEEPDMNGLALVVEDIDKHLPATFIPHTYNILIERLLVMVAKMMCKLI